MSNSVVHKCVEDKVVIVFLDDIVRSFCEIVVKSILLGVYAVICTCDGGIELCDPVKTVFVIYTYRTHPY